MNTMRFRAILILPKLRDVEAIKQIRERYDPSFGKISLHITLVFPFRSEIPTQELRSHVETGLKGCSQFSLRMQGITGHEGNHLFLNVIHGNDAIIDLHRRLYSGLFARYRNRGYTFFPHLTVGRFYDETAFDTGLKSLEAFDMLFETVVDEVSIIGIEPNGCSAIEAVLWINDNQDQRQ